ncbi:MAG TPA: hypothetical protein VGO28_11705, partial [Acidimicrobiia bacterium]
MLRGRAFGIGATALLFVGLAFLIATRGGTPAGTFRVPSGPQGLATSGGAVWVASTDEHRVSRFDPRSHHITATINVGGAPLSAAFGGGSVWVTEPGRDEVVRVDPSTRATTKLPVGDTPTAIAADDAAVWVANNRAETLSRIDPAIGAVAATVPVTERPAGVAVGSGS